MIEATCPECGETLSVDGETGYMDKCECGELVIGKEGGDW
jgi:tRNA(Ile2) C34 agmatinyltransferase TiaS